MAVQDAIQHFVEHPLKMNEQEVRDLLWQLCVELGYCLDLEDQRGIEQKPPTDPASFARLVMALEGVGSGDPDFYEPVIERVLMWFQRVSASAA